MNHTDKQKEASDRYFSKGSRPHISTTNSVVRYLTRWRVCQSIKKLERILQSRFTRHSSILVMCAGEGGDGTYLCDLGYRNVTVSDISHVAVDEALRRDIRLKGLVLNAQQAEISDCSYDVVMIQDGLHHLQNPVAGFTEMLRIARIAVIFLEPHDSFFSSFLGTQWEGDVGFINYVFRWNKKLCTKVTFSYLGPDSFTDYSYAFWHHNIYMERASKIFGGGLLAKHILLITKFFLDLFLGEIGNQFCCLIVKKQPFLTK